MRENYGKSWKQNQRPRFDDRPKHGTDQDLLELLHGLDGSSYGAYKRVIGEWEYDSFRVFIDRIQADPYAPPSSVRIVSTPKEMGLPVETFSTVEQRLATADFLTRSLHESLRLDQRFRAVSVVAPGQEILERSAATVTENRVELRIQVAMPARGRTILGHQAATIFDVELPDAVLETIDFISPHASDYLTKLVNHVHTYEDFCALQRQLNENNWVSFIPNNAILARSSGISELPMTDSVPFEAPLSLQQTVSLPHAGNIQGMPILPGITVIVGGGYHGKSTVLSAIERGVYSHVPADGRELVATIPSAMKVRAADGRPVAGVDISPFINHLPTGAATTRFSTQNASGSTSQAASIIEALEVGSKLLLIDEDTSATNLMIRDARMRELVSADQEPITALVDRIKGMSEARNVSLILVTGGSGAFLDVADHVLQMNNYVCEDVTDRALEVASAIPRERGDIPGFPDSLPRAPLGIKTPSGKSRTKASGLNSITLDKQTIDVSDVEQIVEAGQTEAIAWAIRAILQTMANGEKSIQDLVYEVDQLIEKNGLDTFSKIGARRYPAFLTRPRPVDIAAALNRYRTLKIA